MDKQILIDMGIEEAKADKVIEAVKEELKGFIPKSRFDEVNDAKKKLEQDVATRDGQLEELKKSAGDSTELQAKIKELQTANENATKQHEKELYDLKLNIAIDQALTTGKARNTQMVKAMLKMDNIKLDGESLIGVDEQLKALKADPSTSFAFVPEGEPDTSMKGSFKPGDDGNNGAPGKAQPKTYADFCKMYPQN